MKICHSEPRLVFDGVRNLLFPWPFCEQQIPHPQTRVRDDNRGFFRSLWSRALTLHRSCTEVATHGLRDTASAPTAVSPMCDECSRQACRASCQVRSRCDLAGCSRPHRLRPQRRGPHYTKREAQEQPVERRGSGKCEQRGNGESRDTQQSDHGSLPVVRQGDGIPAANRHVVEKRMVMVIKRRKYCGTQHTMLLPTHIE